MKKSRLTAVVIMTILGLTITTFATTEKLTISASGNFSNRVVVSGKVKGFVCHELVAKENLKKYKGLWLGITAIIGSKEIDFTPVRVDGYFKVKQEVSLSRIVQLSGGTGKKVRWIARLWGTKINRAACSCSYCKKNGCHLEGQGKSARTN
jgi:hypothetical protein